MAIGVLVLGAPGTGKSYSIKGFSPDEVKIISVTKPILPFRGKYEIAKVDPMSDRIANQVIKEMKNTDKKRIVIDDFQHILGRPMMERIGEKGWDKYSEIQQPYADILNEVPTLPDDVIVYFTSHTKTEDDGTVHIQTIGNAMDKYLSPEGLFMIVLGTAVNDGKYFFVTQNNGSNTLKSPEGMFPSLYIPNNLKYVDDKIRNYYYMDGAKTDEEIAAEDVENTVSEEEVKKKRGRKSRKESVANADAGTGTIVGATPEEQEEKKTRSRRKRKVEPKILVEDSYFFIEAENNVVMKHAGDAEPEGAKVITKEQFNAASAAIATNSGDVDVAEIINGTNKEEVPFEEIEQHPELMPDKPAPRRGRRGRRA